MDEAERCHRLAYIAYGKLLATGTPEELLHLFALATWEVSGPPHAGVPGIAHVTAFGNTLHVTGEDAQGLEQAILPFSHEALKWRPSQPGLEDVFIHLMAGAPDNFQ
jgi:ABC-2 type transport system ATP-binding protein